MRTCRGFAVQCRLTNPMAVGKVKSMAPEGHASLLACEIPTAIGMVHDPRGLFRWRTKMKRSEIERKRLLAQYGHLYSNHEYERMPGGLGCFYCGEPPSSKDHIPALSAVDLKEPRRWRDDGIKFLLVPSCTHCNSLLGRRQLFTPAARAEYIATRLELTYDRQAALWRDDEIAEMGPEFQRTIRARQRSLSDLLQRVRAAQWRFVRESVAELESEGD